MHLQCGGITWWDGGGGVVVVWLSLLLSPSPWIPFKLMFSTISGNTHHRLDRRGHAPSARRGHKIETALRTSAVKVMPQNKMRWNGSSCTMTAIAADSVTHSDTDWNGVHSSSSSSAQKSLVPRTWQEQYCYDIDDDKDLDAMMAFLRWYW